MGTDDAGGLDPPSWARAELASEQPAHDVELIHGFWIDRYEVANEAFAAYVAAGGYNDIEFWSDDGLAWLDRQDEALPVECVETGPTHPRVCITWYEAEAYSAWRGGRLPTEAEWEYAARGPDSLVYPWGDSWDPNLANIVDADGTVRIGSYPGGASWIGVEDMTGNVMEWASDWWSDDYYQDEVGVDPAGPDRGTKKVEKGGWWGAVPYVGRTAYRHFEDRPTYQDHHIGFRIVSDQS
jgi:formylglycine-generating enzyme required for sulfatase activity